MGRCFGGRFPAAVAPSEGCTPLVRSLQCGAVRYPVRDHYFFLAPEAGLQNQGSCHRSEHSSSGSLSHHRTRQTLQQKRKLMKSALGNGRTPPEGPQTPTPGPVVITEKLVCEGVTLLADALADWFHEVWLSCDGVRAPLSSFSVFSRISARTCR